MIGFILLSSQQSGCFTLNLDELRSKNIIPRGGGHPPAKEVDTQSSHQVKGHKDTTPRPFLDVKRLLSKMLRYPQPLHNEPDAVSCKDTTQHKRVLCQEDITMVLPLCLSSRSTFPTTLSKTLPLELNPTSYVILSPSPSKQPAC